MKTINGRTCEVEHEIESGDRGFTYKSTWFKVTYSSYDLFLCHIGLHRLTRDVRCNSWHGLRQHVRGECACGMRHWLWTPNEWSPAIESSGHQDISGMYGYPHRTTDVYGTSSTHPEGMK
jgi:hypothetical protein